MAKFDPQPFQGIALHGDLGGGARIEFPNVEIELRVEDRNRNPIVGLKESNFLVTEEKLTKKQREELLRQLGSEKGKGKN